MDPGDIEKLARTYSEEGNTEALRELLNDPHDRPRAVPLSQPHAATASCEEMHCVESSYLEICGEHDRDPLLFMFPII